MLACRRVLEPGRECVVTSCGHADAGDPPFLFAAPYAAAAFSSKGRLIRCTVPGSTSKRLAILRTPSVRPGAIKAARILDLEAS
jgi:hypothetical protein